MTEEYFLFTFDSTLGAMAAAKLFSGLDVVLMPTLREIRVSCGMSLRLSPEKCGQAEERIQNSDVSGWQLYKVTSKKGERPVCVLFTRG